MKSKIHSIILFITFYGSLSFGSEFKYWGTLGGGIGNRDFDEFIYSPLDISGNVSYKNILLNTGIDLVHRTDGVCALDCYYFPNKFLVNSLIGYIKTWEKFGFSIKTGISYSKQYGGNYKYKNAWKFDLPIKGTVMLHLHQYVGLEGGISTWVRNGSFITTDYYSIARVGLIFGTLPFSKY